MGFLAESPNRKGGIIMNFKNPDTSVISDKKLYIFDMDGTIYLGFDVFPYAIRFIKNLRKSGKKEKTVHHPVKRCKHHHHHGRESEF